MQSEKVRKRTRTKITMIKAETAEQTLAEVIKEMAKPRVSKSARAAERSLVKDNIQE